MPEVSVIVSLYNHGRYLGQCVASVLEQRFADLEVVIVDDASTDDSLETARALERLDPARVKLCVNPVNLGVGRTRNFGVYASKGPILAFLDADDYWRPDKLEEQVKAFRQDSDLGLSHSGVTIACDADNARWAADNRGRSAEALAHWGHSFNAFCREAAGFGPKQYFQRLLYANNICLSSVAMRREVFKRARGFLDGALCQSEDWLLWLKCSLFARLRPLPEPLTVYRFHQGGHTAQVLMRPDFDVAGVRAEVVRAARKFDPARFDALLASLRPPGP